MGLFGFLSNGPAKATVKTKDSKLVINKTDVEVLNKNIVDSIANTTISNAAKCGASATSSQEIKISNITASEDANFDINQKSDIILNFSCTQASETRIDAANELFTKMMNDISKETSTDVMTALNTQAKTKAKGGFLSFGAPASKSKNITDINYKQINDSHTDLQNVIKKSITNNFSSDDIKTCTAQLAGNQTVAVNDITAGRNVNFRINQDQSLKTFSECKQLQDTANSITNVIIDAIGVEVSSEDNTNASSNVKAEASAEVIADGLFESLGSFVGSIFSGLASIYGIIASVIGCVFCICIIVLCVMFFGSKGQQQQQYQQQQYQQQQYQPQQYQMPVTYQQPITAYPM
jgi:hypothetical protein